MNTYGDINCSKCNSSTEVTYHQYVGAAYCAICGVWIGG